MTEKSKLHIDSCRFCWMCRHICPIGNATGQERNTARARALALSLVNRDALKLEDVIDNMYECATCGACAKECATGWDPVTFIKEARLSAALEGKTPVYINRLIDCCLDTGNAYGVTALQSDLADKIAEHSKKTDLLLFLGTDARYAAPSSAINAIRVMEMSGLPFTVLENEPASGEQLEFLLGAAEETKAQMEKCVEELNHYQSVVIFDPADAKLIKRTYQEYKLGCTANLLTFTTYLSKAELDLHNTGHVVAFQDPFQLSRDLKETENPRSILEKCAVLREMLLNRKDTMWAGNLLMAEYMPETVKKVSMDRIKNAQSVGINTIVTASVGENAALNAVAPEGFRIVSLEELVLEAASREELRC